MAKFGRQISLRLHTSAGSKGGASHPSFSSLHPSRHTKHILSSAQRLRLGENFSALGSTPGLHLFSLSEAAKTRWKTKSKVQAVHGGRRASTEAKEECSWVDLGLSSEITKSLLKTGFDSPSQTQIISIPDLVKGKDVVIAAETGSGKTVAYLAPLLSRLASVSASPPADSMDPRGSRDEKVGLVLCPNIQLCKQVSKVAKELALHFNQEADPVQRVRVYDITEEDYYDENRVRKDESELGPVVIVCTPSLFENRFVRYDAGAPRVDLNVKVLVLDETDMLLTGGFEPVTMSILDWSQYEDKQLKIDSVLENTRMSFDQFQRMPYKIKRAAYRGGLQGMIEAGWENNAVDPNNVKDFEKCQYVFTGATIPDYGTKSVQLQIEKICPSASWVRGEGLHNPSSFKERLTQDWFEVGSMEEAYEILLETIRDSPGRLIVFNRDVKLAEECADVLRDQAAEHLNVLEFHRKVFLEERIENLESFKQLEDAVLVCTDAASRGLDIPNVSCVIQMGFASSAVDYLHRIGRTARAGKRGKVINIYTQESEDLVKSVMRAIEEERSVQEAFSRKRSFRKKIRKGRMKKGN